MIRYGEFVSKKEREILLDDEKENKLVLFVDEKEIESNACIAADNFRLAVEKGNFKGISKKLYSYKMQDFCNSQATKYKYLLFSERKVFIRKLMSKIKDMEIGIKKVETI